MRVFDVGWLHLGCAELLCFATGGDTAFAFSCTFVGTAGRLDPCDDLTTATTCAQDLVCANNQCRVKCDVAQDCAVGELCAAVPCGGGAAVCFPAP